jgi:ABC-type lipoprotein export system ATPase subunit/bifunctional DNA-binding transcriptional regulator/antitoxin component of YhaV-PrlF toxin-antitoxin module
MVQRPFIICDNLVKIYQVAELEVVALQGLDLVVEPGELLGIVGVSGSGKSTLMNILGGLDRPSAGRVWVNNLNLLKLSNSALDRYRCTTVGFVWQQSSRNLIPYLTAQENVELPMTLAGESGRNKRQRADYLLEAVDLLDRRKHRLSELSGGEQQRIAIAVALANNPNLLLADEPTGEVDETTSEMIYKTIQRLNQEFGLTTLIVSHDPGIAHYMDRVVAIRDGKTATETIRQSLDEYLLINGEGEVDQQQVIEIYEEFVVLDSAGRLQVPQEYLEHFGIKGRAKLDITDEGILLRPTLHLNDAQSAEQHAEDITQERKSGGLLGFLSRWRRERLENEEENGDI